MKENIVFYSYLDINVFLVSYGKRISGLREMPFTSSSIHGHLMPTVYKHKYSCVWT